MRMVASLVLGLLDGIHRLDVVRDDEAGDPFGVRDPHCAVEEVANLHRVGDLVHVLVCHVFEERARSTSCW